MKFATAAAIGVVGATLWRRPWRRRKPTVSAGHARPRALPARGRRGRNRGDTSPRGSIGAFGYAPPPAYYPA